MVKKAKDFPSPEFSQFVSERKKYVSNYVQFIAKPAFLEKLQHLD